ncbi:MAG: electron transfer flavoprotein subunit alpha/FixB family protein [Candidatus Bathyarchaeota archaeon]|nr:MAG: electron transfer flavoprotein subunit alpha/FixB family protein [Candidatus Bathyarchaeota archaeon]
MTEIFVLAEHRQGQIRDLTMEMLTKGRELAEKVEADLIVILLGKDIKDMAQVLRDHAKKVIMVEDPGLENFNSDLYQEVLAGLIEEHKPLLTLIGHTSFGVDLAPSLAASLNTPLATDCIDLKFKDDVLIVTRQMYGGKVNAEASLRKAESYIVTVRQATFPAEKEVSMEGEIIQIKGQLPDRKIGKRFVQYVLPPPGGVDITSADVIVAIGRGIKDSEEIPQVEDLANALGGVLACSRPIVDKGWLPDDRQVGSSGKTVKPKLYIALGISGAFQHILGMKNSDLIVAVNKDPKAPIFGVADYGVVEDLFKLIKPVVNEIKEIKG